eukprot:2987787-Amphidinium_carterae.3
MSQQEAESVNNTSVTRESNDMPNAQQDEKHSERRPHDHMLARRAQKLLAHTAKARDNPSEAQTKKWKEPQLSNADS